MLAWTGPDLGDSSALLDESKDDLDEANGIVGSSFRPLVRVLDVRRVSTDDVNLFPDVLDGLRDRLPQSSPVLDQLREDVEKFSDHAKELRDDVKQSRDDVKESSHDVKESSQRRFGLQSSSSGLRA